MLTRLIVCVFFFTSLSGCNMFSGSGSSDPTQNDNCTPLEPYPNSITIAVYCQPNAPAAEDYVVATTIQFGAYNNAGVIDYLYTLNVESGIVTDSTGTQIYQLSFAQGAVLAIAMSDVYASTLDFNNPYQQLPEPVFYAERSPSLSDYAVINNVGDPLVLNDVYGPDLYEQIDGEWQVANFDLFIRGLQSSIVGH